MPETEVIKGVELPFVDTPEDKYADSSGETTPGFTHTVQLVE